MVDPKKLIKMSIKDATTPPDKDGDFRVLKDRYWATDGEHIFFFKTLGSPQCNPNKAIAEMVGKATIPGSSVIFLETVYTKTVEY